MSSKQRAPESEVVQFFLTAELEVARTVFRVVRGVLNHRETKTPRTVTAPRRLRAGGGSPSPAPGEPA